MSQLALQISHIKHHSARYAATLALVCKCVNVCKLCLHKYDFLSYYLLIKHIIRVPVNATKNVLVTGRCKNVFCVTQIIRVRV